MILITSRLEFKKSEWSNFDFIVTIFINGTTENQYLEWKQEIEVSIIRCHHFIIANDPTLNSANSMLYAKPCHALQG